MKAVRLALAVAVVLMPASAHAAEWSAAQTIKEMNYDGDADTLWFMGQTGWGAPGCPNATWIVIPATVAGRKQLLAIGLTAQTAGKTVAFWGTCDSSERFYATYMRML